MQTLREFLVREWGEEVLDNTELINAGADEDYSEEITARYFDENHQSRLVVAGDTAIISAPANIIVMRADEITDEYIADGGWLTHA